MNAQAIKDEINRKVERTDIENKPNLQLSEKYSRWTIGITNDLDRRKGEHSNDGKNVKLWKGWTADTEDIARSVEDHFHSLGMKGDSGGGSKPDKVYIF